MTGGIAIVSPGCPGAEVVARIQASSPAIIPRNHKVEEALAAATERADMAPLERLLAALARPFDHGNVPPEFASPAPPDAAAYRTFCGT